MIKDFNIYEIFPTEDSYKPFLYNLKFKNLLAIDIYLVFLMLIKIQRII